MEQIYYRSRFVTIAGQLILENGQIDVTWDNTHRMHKELPLQEDQTSSRSKEDCMYDRRNA